MPLDNKKPANDGKGDATDAAGGAGTTGGAGATGGTGAPGGGGGNTGGAKNKESLKVRPPPTYATPPPNVQVLQLTPDLFQQTVAAAVTAALAANTQQVQPVVAPAAVPVPAVIPRKEKKLADFWTSRPTMWFRLFEGQFPSSDSQDVRFNALLNHLPSSSLPFVDHILRAPGQDPYDRAKACLIKHYEVSPRDLARRLRALTSLGDRTPSEMLYYMRSLLPGVPDNALFEAIFIDLLPPNARDAAVKHDLLEDMALAADKVLAEAPSASTISAVLPDDHSVSVLAQVRSTPQPSSRRTQAREASLCYVHARYGKNSFRCASPKTCKMRDVVVKPEDLASGNAKAGR